MSACLLHWEKPWFTLSLGMQPFHMFPLFLVCFRHIMEQYQFLVYSFFKEMYSKLCKNEGTTKDKAIKSFISFQVQCHSVFFFLNATMY